MKSLTKKIYLTLFAGLIVLSAYFIVHAHYLYLNTAEKEELRRLKGIANALSAQMSGEEYQMILSMFPNKDDISLSNQSDYYYKQHTILKTTQELNQLETPIYTITYDSLNQAFFFGITSAEHPYYRHAYNSYPPELLANYQKGGAIETYEDEHGVWLSAFAPIKHQGEVVAQIVVDMPFESFIRSARNELWRNILISLIIVVVIGLIVFKLLSNILKEDRKRRKVIRQKSTELSIKNKEIISSLRYAKRIQDTILPAKSELDQSLSDYFIYYEPRDIVAGDFYWLAEKEGATYLACADCTGHGVPGAMVSVICSKALDTALLQEGILEPAQLLDRVSCLVEEAFTTAEAEIKDGMDIILCKIEENGKTVTFSGANNPLYRVADKQESVSPLLKTTVKADLQLIEYKSDKQPIGRYANRKAFTQQSIELKEGDMLYLFTDGYADQFGGERGKKFLYKAFKDLLLRVNRLPLSQQKERLLESLKEWKGDEEQVDDICVIGLRF